MTTQIASCPSCDPSAVIEAPSIATFRNVLRDGAFGEMLASGQDPGTCTHLFSTIQSFNARDLIRRFGPLFQHMHNKLQLLIATGNQSRARLYGRLFHHPTVWKIFHLELETVVRPYCLRAPMLSVARLQYPTRQREATRQHVRLIESEEPTELLYCDGLIHNN